VLQIMCRSAEAERAQLRISSEEAGPG